MSKESRRCEMPGCRSWAMRGGLFCRSHSQSSKSLQWPGAESARPRHSFYDGLFSKEETLVARLLAAAESSGERLWRLPLYDDYLDKVESLTADLANTGGRYGGVGSSAIFLQQFAEGYPWAHLDIAGMAFEERPDTPKRPPHLRKGGTGFGVRLLVQFVP